MASTPAPFDIYVAAGRVARVVLEQLERERYFPENNGEIKFWRLDVDDQGGVSLMYPCTYSGYRRSEWRRFALSYLGPDTPVTAPYDGCSL